MSILEGPRADAQSGKADSLVILLHGYGADGNDLFGIGGALAPHLPNTIFRSPNAPERCKQSPKEAIHPGRQHMITKLGVLGFFESVFGSSAQRRNDARELLLTHLPGDFDEASFVTKQ